VSNDEQLAWEARARWPAAAAAFAAALLSLASSVYFTAAIDRGDGSAAALRSADVDSQDYIVSSVLQAVSVLLLVPPLFYLWRAARHRRAETMSAAGVLIVFAGVTVAIATVLRQVQLVDIAHGFFPEKANAAKDLNDAAEDEIRDNLSPVLEGLALGAGLAFAFSFVVISLNAMRAGLLSRFMGMLGILVAVLLLIPLSPVPIVQIFWLAGIGLLFLDRWPGGRGPAWQTGEEVPWPGAAEQRDEIVRRRAEREGAAAEPEPEPQAPRPASRKRRKKQR
jgi:hypothetical protein